MTAIRRVYLAGPMRGYPEFNFPEFFDAAASLRIRGFEVWSPAERDLADGLDPKNEEHRKAAEEKGLKYYMHYDLPAVVDSDAVAVLPNWQDSEGARLEVFTAWVVGMPVFFAWSETPIPRWSVDLQTPFIRDHFNTLIGGKC